MLAMPLSAINPPKRTVTTLPRRAMTAEAVIPAEGFAEPVSIAAAAVGYAKCAPCVSTYTA